MLVTVVLESIDQVHVLKSVVQKTFRDIETEFAGYAFNPQTHTLIFKISFIIIHVIKYACWLLMCQILWAFTIHEMK